MDIIRDNYSLLQVVSRFGLSLGFGEQTVQAVCRACGVDTDTFLAVVNLLNRPEATDARHPDFGSARGPKEGRMALQLPTLLQYLRQSHAYFLDFCLPGIRRRLMEAIDCSMQNEVAFLLLKFFDQYMNEVRKHMHYEDTQVFPYVERLLETAECASSAPSAVASSVQCSSGFSIRQFATHHDQIDAKLSELKNLLIQYYPASGNNYRLNAVLLDLYSCEQELAAHTRVEDHLFVPAVFLLECPDAVSRLECPDADGVRDSLSAASGPALETGAEVLTDREKEIVCCVAKGMINKEIAEALFLSIHTVTTHRKNIARKLQIHSVAGLAIYAIAHRLVELSEVKL